MTSRRTYQGAQPSLTRGDDLPAPKCNLGLVEAVWNGYAAANAARPILKRLCKECPLRDDCWSDPAWRDALGVSQEPAKPTKPRGDRLTEEGRAKIRAHNHEHNAQFNAARVADLKALAASGTSIAQAARQLGVKENTLRTWCRRNGHGDLLAKLSPPRPAAVVSRRRRVA